MGITGNSTIIVGRTSNLKDSMRQRQWQEQQRKKNQAPNFAELLKQKMLEQMKKGDKNGEEQD